MRYTTKSNNPQNNNEGKIMRSDTVMDDGKKSVHVSCLLDKVDDRLELYFTQEELTTIFKRHFPAVWGAHDKWNELDDKIHAFYFDENGDEIEGDEGGDLCDIGEVAAMAFGYL